MDEGEKDAETILQPCWFQQEISSLYSAWRTSTWSIKELRGTETTNWEAFHKKEEANAIMHACTGCNQVWNISGTIALLLYGKHCIALLHFYYSGLANVGNVFRWLCLFQSDMIVAVYVACVIGFEASALVCLYVP